MSRAQMSVKWDTILACQPSMFTQRSIHHQKSSSDSPFHANTGTPAEKHPLLMEEQTRGDTKTCQLVH